MPLLASATVTPPTGLSGSRIVTITDGVIERHNFLNWTNNASTTLAGRETTVIVGKAGSYPLNQYDGTELYNGTGQFLNHTGLTYNVDWYYRAYTYNITTNGFSANISSYVNVNEVARLQEVPGIDPAVVALAALVILVFVFGYIVAVWALLRSKQMSTDLMIELTIGLVIAIIMTGIIAALL